MPWIVEHGYARDGETRRGEDGDADLDSDVTLKVVLESLQVQLQHRREGVEEVAKLRILGQVHRVQLGV